MCYLSPMPIYTKTGDLGETSLMGKDRHSKSQEIFEVLGTLDELNASLGMVRGVDVSLTSVLNTIQQDLFLLGALLAGSKETSKILKKLEDQVEKFEKEMDSMNSELPELTNFILPGGSYPASKLHFSRAICRRLERNLVTYTKETDSNHSEIILKYINRLSDLLFMLARYENHKKGNKDILWEGI